MTQFETLPLSATQANDDDIDPGFLVPDYGNVIPPFDEEIDPDFSVMKLNAGWKVHHAS